MPMTPTAVESGRAVFTPGRLELVVPDDAEMDITEFELARDPSRIFTFGGTISAVSKTLGPFHGEIREDATRDLIATLDDVRVTVTRMTGQQGQSFYVGTLEHFVTSHGWRTGDGRSLPGATSSYNPGREPYGASQEVRFQNQAGGTMWSEGGLSFQFHLHCNDRRKHQMFSFTENAVLGWFDDWVSYTQYIHGPFFRC